METTILDGGGEAGNAPGVLMAEGSTLDGFTVTNVGVHDDAVWKKHFDSHGEDLGDEEGSVQAEGTTPAISIHGHDNKLVAIGEKQGTAVRVWEGSTATVSENSFE